MVNLNQKLGSMEYDDLISNLTPQPQVRGGTIAKGLAEFTLKRGTILEKDSSGKLHILGTDSDNEPYAILCDDVTVGTSNDEKVAIYTAGCFNTNKVIADEGYTITDADFDALRKYGIVFKAESAAR